MSRVSCGLRKKGMWWKKERMLSTLDTRVQWYNRVLTRSRRVEGQCSSEVVKPQALKRVRDR